MRQRKGKRRITKKILLVDDEPNIVRTVEARLKASGYEVISATDGLQGLNMARTCKPDLIILDLMLPKMDGYKICGLLKKDIKYQKIPIVLFTARAQEADRQMGEDVNADAYITKPFKAELLLGKIKELLNG